ncbi:probable methyltransferase-like protein 15 homolog [Uloborus diversus]|uniref:probable methyltransferase-like protein 15 homolog n=1 Tax=Uloborus diversus TaxID=327109 RepID=UPI002409AA86|nr:probable methyltransferase-like protein 15 homolog [Uloborus diversus]
MNVLCKNIYFVSREFLTLHIKSSKATLWYGICKSHFNTHAVSSDINCENSENPEEYSHVPVMPKEIIEALQPKDGQVFIDMTFGAGGHSSHLLNTAKIKLYCLDRDPVAYEKAQSLAKSCPSVTPILGRFSQMESLLKDVGVKPNSVDGILIDAGCSSMQLDSAERGFSFNKNGRLDMRMDCDRYPNQATAADVLNTLDVQSLAKILKVYGEERHAKKIARALFDARFMLKTINTTHELANLVESILGREQRFDKLNRPVHVATKVFQALRIFVNDELNELNYGMQMAHMFLKPGGRVATLAFHSLEDRIFKRHIMGIDIDEPISHGFSQKYHNSVIWHPLEVVQAVCANKWTSMYKHVLKPSLEEVNANPRSRSARLRAAIKI